MTSVKNKPKTRTNASTRTTAAAVPEKRTTANVKTIFREVVKPEPTEKVGARGEIKWGEFNLHPQFLNGLYYDNPVHGGIINQKVKFITAGGIRVEGADDTVLENGDGMYTIMEVVEGAALDFEIGEINTILWTRNLSTDLWECEAIGFELIRATEDGIFYEYSNDWGKGQQSIEKTGYRLIKAIERVNMAPVDQGGDTECLMVCMTRPKQRIIKGKELTKSYYPFPNYSGAIVPIMTSIEMDFFSLSEVVNGFKGGTLINLANGIPESEEKEDEIIDRIKGEATSRNRQGGLTVTFSDGKERAPTVEQINGNDLDKRYLEAGKSAIQKTMIAHGVISPALFGVLSETMFGSKEEMEIAYTMFQENYVTIRQRNLIAPMNWALKKLNGFTGKLVMDAYVPAILKPAEPTTAQMEKMSEDDTERIMDLFSKVGTETSTLKVFHSAPYTVFTDNEKDFTDQFIAGRFAGLTDEETTIIRLVKEGKTYQEIVKEIGKGGMYLSKILFRLKDDGYLKGWEITDKAAKIISDPSEMRVMYSYEEKPGIPPLVGPSSRPFCKFLLDQNRLYTRQEIDAISAKIGRDVWSYRGGWYHNPVTKRTTESCRHIWKQNIVLVNK